MLKAKEMINKQNMMVEHEEDFAVDVIFSSYEKKERGYIRCFIAYNVLQNSWNYSFSHSGNIDFSAFDEKEMHKKIKELTKPQLEKREKKAEEILSSLSITQNYKIYKIAGYGQIKVELEGATVGKEKVDITWFLFDEKSLHVYFLGDGSEQEDFEEMHFGFSWEFAKKHLKGMKEFEEFLFTKSKDRLTFLF